MAITVGSLFDGSGGFPLAGCLCGIVPLWASEIEPYPIAVTKSRFPAMKHLGDISKINGAAIDAVDIITFGSPCQDLSVAGKRAGLKHEANGDEKTTRSGLFMEAVRIIKEMRGATNGKCPRFALWENVPGAFSSNKGEDFRIVLEELIKISETKATVPPAPKSGWPYADAYVGDGWSLAYRTFDAQYWGVPQRRRRIYLVADFVGRCAPGILFEREGVRGYFTEGESTWQGTTADAEGSFGANGYKGKNTGIGCCVALNSVASTLRAGAGAPNHEADFVGRLILQPMAFAQNQRNEVRDLKGKTGALAANHGMKQQTYIVEQTQDISMVLFEPRSQDGVPRIHKEISPTLNTAQGGQRQPCVALSVYCIQGNCIERSDNAGCGGKGWREDASFTLNTIDRPAVVVPQVFRKSSFSGYVEGEFGTLRADLGGGSENLVTILYVVRRLTPIECARLQGFPDDWGYP